MRWSEEQARALDAVARWHKRGGSKSFYLAGYAGTGKTTLARHFAESVEGRVVFCAYTGKAASVLRSKGCAPATTIHGLIYKPKGNAKTAEVAQAADELKRLREADAPRDEIERAARAVKLAQEADRALFALKEDPELDGVTLIVVDECSMVSRDIGADLEGKGIPILWLGDPGQLPPVMGAAHLSRAPDFQLEEIHRQASDNAILALATSIRRGGSSRFGRSADGAVDIRPRSAFDWDEAVTADQILCGKNDTRYKLTRGVRRRLGHETLYPLKGEKLVCRRNNKESGLLNGVQGVALSDCRVVSSDVLALDLDYDGASRSFYASAGLFQEHYGPRTSFPHAEAVEHFDYSYALTAHRAQGSEWDDVVVCNERMSRSTVEFHRKWLYTAVTRAAKRLTLYM